MRGESEVEHLWEEEPNERVAEEEQAEGASRGSSRCEGTMQKVIHLRQALELDLYDNSQEEDEEPVDQEMPPSDEEEEKEGGLQHRGRRSLLSESAHGYSNSTPRRRNSR